MQSTRVGDFEVHKIAEYEGPFSLPRLFSLTSPRKRCEQTPII